MQMQYATLVHVLETFSQFMSLETIASWLLTCSAPASLSTISAYVADLSPQ